MRPRRAPLGVVIVGLFALAGVVGPWIAPYDPNAIDLYRQFEGPSFDHPLGTADNGVDILSALLHGARLAAVVGALVTAISMLVGAALGLTAGYFAKTVDHVVSGLADVMQAFPAIVLNIAILALVSKPGVFHLVVALSVSGWVLYARITRAQVFSIREQDYVLAAQALGAGPGRILARHVLPNASGALVVQATTGFGATILAESTLSFLGLGPGTTASWGSLLEQGSGVLLRFPHVVLFSGGAIAINSSRIQPRRGLAPGPSRPADSGFRSHGKRLERMNGLSVRE